VQQDAIRHTYEIQQTSRHPQRDRHCARRREILDTGADDTVPLLYLILLATPCVRYLLSLLYLFDECYRYDLGGLSLDGRTDIML
jgi:hypothetical protein